MYRSILGIRKLRPGYKEILIKPDFRFGFDEVEGNFLSIYGEIYVHLKKDGESWKVNLRTPANTTAYLELPGRERIRLGNGTFCDTVQSGLCTPLQSP